ncbi:hypothetical protein OL233_02530 [Vagococcus sp. PNs007]|uniref:Pesticidal crystal protein Cry22Aa Ig-like domain-containing protein n=1 Tax=Vagococcus proximus TaxID=2991417 RepID=A0ABT5WZG1_9ENTE|nr:hypothetical protein [Vagococcus proximus]MDF0479152.1 hypothetical protein [Vagococcus proximus]
MSKKSIMSKTAKYLMLASVLGTTALTVVNTSVASASSEKIEMVNQFKLMDRDAKDSAITYVAEDGSLQVLEIPKDTKIEVRGHNDRLDVKIGKKTTKINNPKEIIFKGITVKNLVPFYTDSVEKVMLDGVNFEKGTDFSVLKGIDTLLVKDSTFGATDYSLAIHSAPKLTTLEIDNSSFNADIRIYDNHALVSSLISNSTIKDDVRGDNNAKGYFTDFQGNSIVRGKYQKQLTSAGMNANSIFYINKKDGVAIGDTKFNAEKDGKIKVKYEDGSKGEVVIPAGLSITSMTDKKNTITYKLSDDKKKSYTIENAKEIIFKNLNIDTTISFVNKRLRLESLTFDSCKTRLIDVAYSETMKEVKVVRTEISQSSGYLSIYNNKALKYVGLQDSTVEGGSGYISVYNNKTLEEYVMNNTYNYGYLSAYNIGNADLKISNSQFDDYISTDANIQGEGSRVTVGEVPVIKCPEVAIFEPGNEVSMSEFIKALKLSITDAEDGDITDLAVIKGFEDIEFFEEGEYPVTISVTDSDDNIVVKDIIVNVTF